MRIVDIFYNNQENRNVIVNRSIQDFIGCNNLKASNEYRVAYHSPSGRPILTYGTLASKTSISFAHVDRITAIAIDDQSSIGIDLVWLKDSRALEFWATADQTEELPSALEGAFCWAAREAAYKATALDIPFRPANFTFSVLTAQSFRWNCKEDCYEVSGEGKFSLMNSVVCALAVRHSVKSREWT